MKRTLISILILCGLLLAGCNGNATTPEIEATPSRTPGPAETVFPTQFMTPSPENQRSTPTKLPTQTATPTVVPVPVQEDHTAFLNSVAAANGWESVYAMATSPKGTWILGDATIPDTENDLLRSSYVLVKTDGSEILYPQIMIPGGNTISSESSPEDSEPLYYVFDVVGWTPDEDFIFLSARIAHGGCGMGFMFFESSRLYRYQISDQEFLKVNLRYTGRGFQFGYSEDGHYLLYIPQYSAELYNEQDYSSHIYEPYYLPKPSASQIIFRNIRTGEEFELELPREYRATTNLYWLADGSGFILIGGYAPEDYRDLHTILLIDVLKINYPEMTISMLAQNIRSYADDVMPDFDNPGYLLIRGNGIENRLSLQNGELQFSFPTLQP